MSNNFGGGNPPPAAFSGFNFGNAGSAFSSQQPSQGSGNFGSAFGQPQAARGGARGKPQQHPGMSSRGRGGMGPANNNNNHMMMQQSSSDRGKRGGRGNDRGGRGGFSSGGRGGAHPNQYPQQMQNSHQGNMQQHQPQFGANQMMSGYQQQHPKQQHQGPKAFQQPNKQPRSVPASIRGPGPMQPQPQQMMYQPQQSDESMMDVDEQSQNKKKNQKQSKSQNPQQTQQNFTPLNQGKPAQINKNKPFVQTPSPISGFNQTQQTFMNQNAMKQSQQNQSLQRNTSFSSQLSRNSSNQSVHSVNNSAGAKQQQQQSAKPSPQFQNQNKGQKLKDIKSAIDNKKPTSQPKTQIAQVAHGQPFQKVTQQPKAVAPKQTPPPPPQQLIEDDEEEFQEDDYYDEEDYQGEYGEDDLYGEEDPESEGDEVSASPIEFTKEDISQIYSIKKNVPEFSKLCTHFITGQCKYGEGCREKHDQNIKDKFIQLIKLKRGNEQKSKKALQAEDKGEIVKVKPKGPDLRDTVLSKTSVEKQPQEQKKPQPLPQLLAKKPSRDKEEVKGRKTLAPKNPKNFGALENIDESDDQNQQLMIPTQVSRNFQKPLSKSPSLSLQRSDSLSQTTLTCQIIKERMNKYIAEFNEIKSKPQDYIIPQKAECLGMCPDEEIYTRGEVEFSSVSKFERDAQGQNFKNIAIKAYQRSAADKEMNKIDHIRPPIVLLKTLEYMRDCISDLDRLADVKVPYSDPKRPSFTDVQSFCRDRLKSISQDFVVIKQPENKFVIQCLEQIVRYHILVVHDMYLEGEELRQQVALINSNLTNLMASYQAVKSIYPNEDDRYRIFCLRNEAEFNCYQIINLANQDFEALQCISNIDMKYFSKDPKGFEYLKEAMDISLNITKGLDPSRFMIMLKRQKHYLFACLMLQFLNKMRANLLDNIFKSTNKQSTMNIEFISKSLLFDDQQDAISFIEACGFETINDTRVSMENRVSLNNEKQYQIFLKWIQQSPLSFMDRLLGTQQRGQIMQTSLLNSKIPNQIPPANLIPSMLIPSNVITQVQQPKVLIEPAIQPLPIIIEEEEKQSDKIQEQLKKKEDEEKLRKEEIEKKKKADEAAAVAAAAEALKKAKDDAALAEKKRLKEIEEKKEKAIAKFKILAKKKVIQHNQEFKETIIRFKTEKGPLIGMKRQRSITSLTQEIDEEVYLGLVLEKVPSITQQQKIKQIFNDAQRNSRMSQISTKCQDNSVDQIAKNIFKEIGQEGIFRTNLFYHKINNDQNSSASENLQAVLDLMGKSVQIKDEKVNYKFKSMEFPKKDNQRAQTLMSSFLGSNLIVIFSSIKTLNGDLQKIKEVLNLCPQFAQFSMLWLVNRDIDKNSGQQVAEFDEAKLIQDDKEIQIFKRSEVLSSLHVCTLYSSQIKIKQQMPMRKRMNLSRETSSASDTHLLESNQVTKNIALSFMHESLESAIRASKIYQTSKKSIVMLNLKEVINKAIGEQMINLMANQKSQLLKHIKTFSSLKNVKRTGIFQNDQHHEIDILNFLVAVTKKILFPICGKIKSSIQQVCQQFKYSDINIKTSRDLLEQYERLCKVMALKPFTYLDSLVFGQRMSHVQDQIRQQFAEFYEKQATFAHVLKALNSLAVYDSTITQERIQIYHGVSIYQILFAPYFESIPDHSIIFDDSKSLSPIPSLVDLDLTSLLTPSKKLIPKKPLAPTPPQQLLLSAAPQVKKLPSKRTAADKLTDLMKDQMDPLLFSNKEKEVSAKCAFDMHRSLIKIDSHLQEIIDAQEEEEAKQKIREEGNKRVKYDDLREHQEELEKLDKMLNGSQKGSKKRGGL